MAYYRKALSIRDKQEILLTFSYSPRKKKKIHKLSLYGEEEDSINL